MGRGRFIAMDDRVLPAPQSGASLQLKSGRQPGRPNGGSLIELDRAHVRAEGARTRGRNS